VSYWIFLNYLFILQFFFISVARDSERDGTDWRRFDLQHSDEKRQKEEKETCSAGTTRQETRIEKSVKTFPFHAKQHLSFASFCLDSDKVTRHKQLEITIFMNHQILCFTMKLILCSWFCCVKTNFSQKTEN
jgi:hypothetical protein